MQNVYCPVDIVFAMRNESTMVNNKKIQILYVYLFERDFYFSGISADTSALIHDYANMLENKDS